MKRTGIKFAAGCPDWVRAEIEQFPYSRRDGTRIELSDCLVRMVESELTASVWNAFRSNVGHMAVHEQVPADDIKILPVIQVWLEHALGGPGWLERQPESQRRAWAIRVEKAAIDLKNAFEPFNRSGTEEPLPWPLFVARQSTASDLAAEFAIEMAKGRPDHAPMSEEEQGRLIDTSFQSIDYALSNLPEIMRRLEMLAKQIQNMPQVIDKPNHSGADRKYFAIVMTNACRLQFGKPLREHVAAMVNLFFDSNCTASEIQKLAP